jgi:hypothetical protein
LLRHAPRPTLAWLWPLAVALATLPALLRLRAPDLERRVLRAVAWVTGLAAAVSCVGAGLHGRPGIVGWLVGVMLIELAVLGWSATRLVRGMDGPFSFALIAIVACYRGLVGISVLWRGYVLLAVPPLLGRAAVAVCLAGGITLALAVIRLVDQERSARPGRRLAA